MTLTQLNTRKNNHMNKESKYFDGVEWYTNIDIDDSESVSIFQQLLSNEFYVGQEIFFILHRLEDLTENQELRNLETCFLEIFNNSNIYIISYIDDKRFKYLFKYNFDLETNNLIIKFWKYFYSLAFFAPNRGTSFTDVAYYLENDFVRDIYLKRFLAQGFTDCVYIKNMDGDSLIKSRIQIL